jgi:N-formylglutamate amidohydrolase
VIPPTRPASCASIGAAAALVLAACADPLAVRQPSRAPAAAPVADVAPLAVYSPGVTYFGSGQYIEYIAGDLPVIFSAPHGGAVEPASIPARTAAACGPGVTTVTDANTEDLVRQIRTAFFSRTGHYPHVVINRLDRGRLDANRDIGEGACGNAVAEQAWREYHAFLDAAKARVLADHGRGWYTDVHGHGHAIARLELGYELSATTLRRPDAELDAALTFEASSSIRIFSQQSALSFSAALRGPTALGTLLATAGYPTVPSQQDPAPSVGEPYFNGGYNTDRHACSNGGQVCGVQIEANNAGVRNTATNRSNFATAIAAVYAQYLTQFGIVIASRPTTSPALGAATIVDNLNAANDPARARFRATPTWVDGSNGQANGSTFQLESGGTPTAGDSAEFLFHVPAPGTYALEAWWPAAAGRSPSASYRIYELDGGAPLDDLTRDQRENGARWNALGTYRFAQVGWAKIVMSRARSAPGSLAADAIRATLVNRPPVARLTLPATALEGGTIMLVGGSSSDPDGDALSHEWTLGDGGTRAGSPAAHVVANDGTLSVTLTVRDAYGASATATGEIVVANVAPQLAALAGATLLQGESYATSGTFSDPGADPWTATVDYGDGTAAAPLALEARSFVLEHRYLRAGTFTVRATVQDDDASGTGEAQVIVRTPADGVGMLADAVRTLIDDGTLARGTGTSLLAKLTAAAGQLERGRAATAVQQLGAFVHEVEALVRSGRLEPAGGGALTALADRIVRSATPD